MRMRVFLVEQMVLVSVFILEAVSNLNEEQSLPKLTIFLNIGGKFVDSDWFKFKFNRPNGIRKMAGLIIIVDSCNDYANDNLNYQLSGYFGEI